MLRAESIHKRYPTRAGELTVLRDVSLALEVGESAAIIGPSGSGKSTLLSILGTLEPPTEGRVQLDGCDPFSLSPKELARFRNRHVGFIFQDHHLLPQCSVLENVLLPTLVEKRAQSEPRASATGPAPSDGGACPAPRSRSASCWDRAVELLERVGLAERLDHRPAELSGGERQRVAIARALINQPKLLLADEPTGNLDRRTAERVGTLLGELHHEQELVLVVVTHNEALAKRFGRTYELVEGTLAAR